MNVDIPCVPPSTEEQTSRPRSIHTMNVAQPERKAVLTQATAGMKPEGIMLSDISQTRKNKSFESTPTRSQSSIDTESRIVGASS